MIIESILNLLSLVITTVFGFLPSLPQLPTDLNNSINLWSNTVFGNMQLVGVFIRPTTIYILVPLVVVLLNFENIYKLTLFILKKIPMLNVH